MRGHPALPQAFSFSERSSVLTYSIPFVVFVLCGNCDTLGHGEQISPRTGLNPKEKIPFCIVVWSQVCIPVKASCGEGVWNMRYCCVTYTGVPCISGFICAQLGIGKSVVSRRTPPPFRIYSVISPQWWIDRWPADVCTVADAAAFGMECFIVCLGCLLRLSNWNPHLVLQNYKCTFLREELRLMTILIFAV